MDTRRSFRRQRASGPRIPGRLILAGGIAVIALISYWSMRSVNPVTGQAQHVALTVDQEIALGLQSAPEMARQMGGMSSDARGQAKIDQIGAELLGAGFESDLPYPFEFHLLADPNTVNAFALPGGQVFITEALFSRLETDGQIAGVLGHEIGHVIERHSAEHMAKAQLTTGLVGAVGVAATDPDSPVSAQNAAMLASLVGQFINMSYGREDELESDEWGVQLTAAAGFDPRAMIRVMEILDEATREGRPPEFLSTHPDPGNRVQRIEDAIARLFPNGVPSGLRE